MVEQFSIASVARVAIVVLVSLWLLSILVSRILYKRTMGLPLLGREVDPAVPYVNVAAALRAASERRGRLEAFLREHVSQGVVRREFIEVPPRLSNVEPREFEGDRGAAAAHTAHLHWQLADDRLLLVERLVDGAWCVSKGRRQEKMTLVS